MEKKIISPEKAAELKQLYAALAEANQRAAAALHDEIPGRALESEAVARLEAEEALIADLTRRIREVRHS